MSFYTTLAYHYESIFPLTMNHQNLLRSLIPHHASSACDVGCATGLISDYLHSLGLTVTGFDLSESMIHIAQQRSSKDLEFITLNMMDMHNRFKPESFDVITCLGNTLVHLPADEVKDVLQQMHACLSNDGLLIIQIVNYDFIMNERKTQLPIIDNEYIRFKRSYVFGEKSDSIRFIGELHDYTTGITYYDETLLHPLLSNDLREKLQNNFSIIQEFGSWTMQPYDPLTSPSYILIAQKKE